MIKIYHNNRCSKSRSGLNIVEASGKDFKVIKYLENPLSFNELEDIIKTLKINPVDLVRKNETIWKNNFKNKNLSDDDIIKIMVENPKLIERPIVINGNKAIVGRPPELILDII